MRIWLYLIYLFRKVKKTNIIKKSCGYGKKLFELIKLEVENVQMYFNIEK